MYEAFYGLSKKPFQLTPDPEFFFNSTVHKRGLAYLHYGLEQGEGFIVVTGAPGTGKTMLVKELLETILHEAILPGLMVASEIGAEDTLRLVAGAFGLAYDTHTKAMMLKSLEHFFRLKAKEGKRLLLVVDEAQNLLRQSLEELRMLLNFEFDGKPIIQIFMLGQDELRIQLQADHMEQVRQRITATYHLRPLEKEETCEYIVHRLLKAGWNSDPVLTDETFNQVYCFSGGTPRLINSLCDRLLLYGFLEELHVLDSDACKTVINEIEQDSNYPNPQGKLPSAANAPRLRDELDLPPDSLEGRLAKLENLVAELRLDLQKERALLRKAILIQLDMNDAYDVS